MNGDFCDEDGARKLKAKIEAVICTNARPPADPIAEENLRYLEAHRDNIERLQKIVRDPLFSLPLRGNSRYRQLATQLEAQIEANQAIFP